MPLRHLSRLVAAGVLAAAMLLQPLALSPLVLPGAGPAAAEPPAWAPAHGYRAKHGKGRDHRSDYRYDDDERTFGVLEGRCNRELIGQVLGGAVGAAAGSQIGSGSGRTAAIIGGAVLGVLIGGEIGRSMDRADQSCIGQTLEHAPEGRTVRWRNPDDDARYAVTPVETFQRDGRYCREYQTQATINGRSETTYGTACRQPDGSWELAG